MLICTSALLSKWWEAAVDNAYKSGIAVIVASGNSNDDACKYSPAFVPKAITVAASDSRDKRASFSNYGRCIDIWGPGVSILSAKPRGGYQSMSGTSMACPHVAGGAALLLEKNPGMSAAALATALAQSSVKGAISDPKGSINNLLHVGTIRNYSWTCFCNSLSILIP